MIIKKLMDKIIDLATEIFFFLLLCLTLPLALGLSWLIVGAISELLDKAYALAFEHLYIFCGLSVIIGILLKIEAAKRDKETVNRKNG